jgi:hypothetical protein
MEFRRPQRASGQNFIVLAIGRGSGRLSDVSTCGTDLRALTGLYRADQVMGEVGLSPDRLIARPL